MTFTGFSQRYYLHVGAALIILLIGVLSGAAIWKDYQDAWRRADQVSQNLIATLSRDLSGDLETLDISLRGVVRDMADAEIQRLAPELRHRVMFDNVVTSSSIGSIVVLNALGEIVADSASLTPRLAHLADREYFQHHLKQPYLGRYLSLPFESRFDSGDLRVTLSRRIVKPDGSFGGIAALGIPLSRFSDLLQNVNIGREGSISVVRSDGILLMRRPFNRDDIGRDLSNTPNMRRFQKEANGSFASVSALDGVSRFFTFARVGALPLILVVSLSVDEVLADWRHVSIIQGFLTLLVCLAIVGLMSLAQRELRRRRKAENRLVHLARTDELTDLPNRRAFQERFQQEWRQSIRSRAALSVLYIDADFFKRYNDRYGHGAGDELLFALAQALRGCLRRPGDLVARYGGEEFVVLLAETDVFGARVVADNIHDAVLALNIPHDRSPLGRVTVSVGVATAEPGVSDSPEALLQAADSALYDAKASGRNCVREERPILERHEPMVHAATAETSW